MGCMGGGLLERGGLIIIIVDCPKGRWGVIRVTKVHVFPLTF